MTIFKPEGKLIDTAENKKYLSNLQTLQDAKEQCKILEARAVVCDFKHDLIVDLGFCKGRISHDEGAIGIAEGTTRDIAVISRVNKPVCFIVIGFELDEGGTLWPVLSRRQAQQQCMNEYISCLTPGDIISARVTHLEPFGCFVDMGCGIASLIPIDAISVSRISHPKDRFSPQMDIKAVVKSVDATGRVTLSHKELLGTWEQNAGLFTPGETVAGIIRSVETYGVFVELTPNLAGLAEIKENVTVGQHASVYIKSMLSEKMKVKLVIVDAFDENHVSEEPVYFTEKGHMDSWKYSPDNSQKIIETIF